MYKVTTSFEVNVPSMMNVVFSKSWILLYIGRGHPPIYALKRKKKPCGTVIAIALLTYCLLANLVGNFNSAEVPDLSVSYSFWKWKETKSNEGSSKGEPHHILRYRDSLVD